MKLDNKTRKPGQTFGDEPSKTQQHMAGDHNINSIVAKYRQTGTMPFRRITPAYMEVPSESYHEMLNRVTDIRADFSTLPARVKRRFRNDPYQLIRFLENPENRGEAEKLGLIPRSEKEESEEEVDPNQVKMDLEKPKNPGTDDESDPRKTPKKGDS